MIIRVYEKNKLKEKHQPVQNFNELNKSFVDGELKFWTVHKSSPVLVDLTVFYHGEHVQRNNSTSWRGGFSGRPDLITQLAPIVRQLVEYGSAANVAQYIHALRSWWRLFDSVETELLKEKSSLKRVQAVVDISDIHRQRALDSHMNYQTFTNFVRVLELSRKAQRLTRLHWKAPERTECKRTLPPDWQIKEIRFALKHGWFEALRRWTDAELLMSKQDGMTHEEIRLKKNHHRYAETILRTGNNLPSGLELMDELPYYKFYDLGYNITDMSRGIYPDSYDVRCAFFLCLANTGWNPAVLLSLDVEKNFIEIHPKDPARYLMYGQKDRGGSEQISEGLLKSQGSAGAVIATLIKKTATLRQQLHIELKELEDELSRLKTNLDVKNSAVEQMMKRIIKLRRGIKSPWLYVSTKTNSIVWLDLKSHYSRQPVPTKFKVRRVSFLDEIVDKINLHQPLSKKIDYISPGDFRDAFASFAYQISGGMVLFVMKALGHKSPNITQTYLDNSILNQKSKELYQTFSNALWHEIQANQTVDPTIIAKWCRDKSVTANDRKRLLDYRTITLSRLDIGCKSPHNPPRRIAPYFEPDGIKLCPIQRCTLCIEHAVIFPESLSGLCKRLAELRHIKSQIASLAFLESDFQIEMQNTELALSHFDNYKVESTLHEWETRIKAGSHFVIQFDGE